jgi:uncharacterized membrane protein YgcG
MNFFEPLAAMLESQLPSWRNRVDLIALVVLFGVFTTLIRVGTDHIAPTMIEIHPTAYQVIRWAFGLVTGYVTMAILLTALHTAPLQREFLGFKPERMNLFGSAAPDRQWLAFTQHVSEDVFRRPHRRIFDGLLFDLPGKRPPETTPLATFAIRYASRRQRASGGLPPPSSAPAGGGSGGGGGGGGPAPAF